MPLKKKPAPQALLSQLVVALDMGDGDKPPKEFCVFKPGLSKTSKGIFNFTEASGKKCMEAAGQYGNDFMIDYGHAAHAYFAMDPAQAGKAAGWFTPSMKNGALYATDIRWTPSAAKMLAEREYRYFSPVFRHSDDGEIHELVSVGLTNLPATYDMEPLMASRAGAGGAPEPQPSKESRMELAQLIAMLSMKESATEAEVMAELARRGAQIAELTAATGQKDVVSALGTVKAWKAASDTVPALTQRLSEMEKKDTDAKLSALLDEAKRSGKVSPAMEPMLRSMPLEQLPAFLSALPVHPGVNPARELPAPTGGGTMVVPGAPVMLTQPEVFVALKMGISQEQLAKAKQSRAGQPIFEEFSKKPEDRKQP